MDVPADVKKKTRRWWMWMKRLLVVGLVLLVLAVVFHAPLLRWVIGFGGPKGAEMAGITLKWQVDGSVLNDLKFSGIEASGSMVERASIGELAVDYDSWKLVQSGDIDVVKRIALKNVDVVLDLLKLTKSKAKEPEAPKVVAGKPPPLVWPKVIDIVKVNAVVTLADGGKITVRGLSLRVGEGMPGIFECAEFKMEPGDLRVANVKADVAWGDRTLSISGLDLPYGAKLKSLAVDSTKFGEDAVTLGVEAAIGKAVAKMDVRASGLFAPPLKAMADVKLTELSSSDLAAFKLPPDVKFEHVNVDLHAEGPENLSVKGEVRVADVLAAGAMLDSVVMPFRVQNGHAEITTMKVLRGANSVEATAEAELPQDLSQWQKITWKSHAEVMLRDVTQLLAKPPPVKGLVALKVDAVGVGATPTKVSGHVDGTDLGFEAYKLPKLAADFAINGKEATLTLPPLAVGAGNTLALNAKVLMEEVMPVKVDWNVTVDNPAGLIQTVGLPPLDKPVKAKIATNGKAAFMANDVMKLDADLNVSVKDGQFGDAPLPVVEIKAVAAKGEVVLKPCRIVVDERNHMELTAKAKLEEPWSFEADGDIALPELTSLNRLLAAFKVPVIQSGSVVAKLEAAGDAAPYRLKPGLLTLNAKALKMAGMPEAADVDLRTTFVNTTAEMEKLEVVLGPWRTLVKGVVSDECFDFKEISLWQNARRLLSGHASAPWDFRSQELGLRLEAIEMPLHEIAAAAGFTDAPEAMLNLEIDASGHTGAEKVSLTASLRNLKTPGLPMTLSPAQIFVVTALDNNQLELDVKVEQPPLKPLLFKATTPLPLAYVVQKPEIMLSQPLQASLSMAESDLGFLRELMPDQINFLPAKMSLKATIGGTVKAPLIDSSLDMEAAEIGFVSADMPSVRDVRVKVRTHDRKATQEDISAMLAGGKVKLSGTIDAANPKVPSFNLTVMAREALVMRNPTSSVRANADIACVGNLKAARVSGVVEAVRGRIFQEVNLLPNVTGMIQQGEKLPPPPPSTSKSEQKLALPPLLKDWTFDLKVKTRDPVIIAGNLVNGAISADIALGGSGAVPRLTGLANVDRMVLKLPFSLLKITKGVVTMNPDKPFTPKLDVRGESRVGSNDISLYVYGDAAAPKTRFTSTPPLSEADIVTLLGTGMTLGGDNSQMASEAMTRAAFLFVSETYRKMFHKKKTVSDEPPRLHTSFNPSGADRANDSMQALYEITPKVRFIGRFTQTGRMKALLGYVLRFGQAARAMDEEEKP